MKKSAAPVQQRQRLPRPRRVTVIARNLTTRPIQLMWSGDVQGLIAPNEGFEFDFALHHHTNLLGLDLVTPVSPDGATLTPADQSQLYTTDGVWTFGNDIDGTNAAVRLNGFQPNSYVWVGSAMRVDRSGMLHLQNGDEWWVWSPRRFTKTEAP